jgi:cytochrome b
MEKKNTTTDINNQRIITVLVWDPPTRIFHWLLVAGVIVSIVTGNIGPNGMQYHMLSGYAILVLLLFRIVWGFVGSPTSRFSNFIKGPSTVFVYVTSLPKKDERPHLGHNPLGGWSIVVMLLVLFVQAGTGLFANDDIFTEGPLYLWVSKETSDFLTGIHLLNRFVLGAVLATHVIAVLFYLFYKGDNLIKPMITGVKRWYAPAEPATGNNWLAAVVFALAGLAVFLLIR